MFIVKLTSTTKEAFTALQGYKSTVNTIIKVFRTNTNNCFTKTKKGGMFSYVHLALLKNAHFTAQKVYIFLLNIVHFDA